MLQDLRRLFYRDRRRIALSACLLVLAALLNPDALPDPIPSVQTDWLAIGVFAALVPLLTLYAPRQRFWVETLALSLFAFTLVGEALPQLAIRTGTPGAQLLATTVLFALVTATVHVLTWGTWSDRITRLRPKSLRATVDTSLAARDLWYGMVPTPGHRGACPDRDVVSIDYADRAKRVVRMVLWSPPAPPRETLLHFEDLVPLTSVRLRVERRGVTSDWTEQGVTGFDIEDLGDRRRLRVTLDMPHLPPRMIFRNWVDDTLGRMTDRRLTAVEHAARRARFGSVDIFRTERGGPLEDPLPVMPLDPTQVETERRRAPVRLPPRPRDAA